MNKAELIEALAGFGIEADDTMKVAELKAMLADAENGTDQSEENGHGGITIVDALYNGLANKHGQLHLNKKTGMREFEPADFETLQDICENQTKRRPKNEAQLVEFMHGVKL